MRLDSIKNFCNNTLAAIARIEMGFKLLIITITALLLLFQFYPLWEIHIINFLVLVVEEHEYWRLLSSSSAVGSIYFANIMYTLFLFYFLNLSMREIESKYSTLYILIEFIKQTFIINLILTVCLYPFIFYNYLPRDTGTNGLMLTTLNFIWQVGTRCGQSLIHLCFLPFPIKKKYLPWILMILLLAIFRESLVTFMVIFALTMTQHFCLQKPFFALPTNFYLFINRCVPNFIKKMRGYINVDAVRDNLDQICQNWGFSSKIQIQKDNTVHKQFKKYWQQKEENTSEFSQDKQVATQQPEKLMQSNLHFSDVQKQVPQSQKDYREVWKQMQVITHQKQIQSQTNNHPEKISQIRKQKDLKEQKSYKQHWSSISNKTQNQQNADILQKQNNRQFSQTIQIQPVPTLSQEYQVQQQVKESQQLQIDHPTYNAESKKNKSKVVQAHDQQQEWY